MNTEIVAPWRIDLLGGLRLERGAEVVTRFRSQKIGALLAFLALNPQRPHTREELADRFWPDADPEAARTNLRTALSTLRRQLEPPGIESGSVLVTRGHADVHLSPAAFETDVARFERALQTAARPTTPDDERARLLDSAVELYRGPLLPGFYETWALSERDRLAEAYLGALRQLVAHFQRTGALDRALDHARRAVAADPLSEDAHADVIRLLHATGKPSAARRHFAELTRLLETELGSEPSDEVRLLAERGVPPAPRPVVVVAAAVSPSPVPKMETPSSPAVTPPTPSVVHLPPTMTRFFGRTSEIQQIAAALADTRLVTLTGPGGSGKTRLAVETARRLGDRFPDGVWFVPLADLREPGRIPEAIVDAMRLIRSPNASAMEQICAALRGASSALLILDNFEQIVEQGVPIVQTLLSRLPGVTVLVTSRQRLLLDGEREVALPPLPIPTRPGTPEGLLEFAGVQLFVNRAQAARPDFQLTTRNAAVVTQLCARLEGVPLALELAAAWAQTLTPAQMLDRLERRFDLLVSRRRDAPGRHATLRAAIEWSYHLLPADLRTFFAQLSVFHGGWTLDAAEAVTGEPNALAFLAELKDRSLLVIEESDTHPTLRFAMLEMLREFAVEQLNAAPNDAACAMHRRHAAYFADLAERAAAAIHSPDAADWLDRLESDHDNFRAALAWCETEPDAAEMALTMAAALHRFWYMRGYLAEGRRRLHSVLAAPGADRPTLARATALYSAAGLAVAQGELDAAAALHAEALEIYRARDDQRGVANCLCQLGLIATGQGKHADAKPLYEACLALSAQTKDDGTRAHTLKCLGANALACGEDPDAAEALFRESLALYRRFGDKRGIAMVLGELGNLELTVRADPPRAAEFLEEHLALSRQIKDLMHIAHALQGLSRVAQHQGDYALAHRRLVESLNCFGDDNGNAYLIYLLEGFARLAAVQAFQERAVQLQAAADRLRREIDLPRSKTDQGLHDEEIAAWRDSVGAERFDRAWAAGDALSLPLALALAREEPTPPIR